MTSVLQLETEYLRVVESLKQKHRESEALQEAHYRRIGAVTDDQKRTALWSCFNPVPKAFQEMTAGEREWLERMCATYLSCDAGMRANIRRLVTDFHVVWYLVGMASDIASQKPLDAPQLRLAIAAILIADCGDERDAISILARLCGAAYRAGIRVDEELRAAAAIAGTNPRRDVKCSMQDLLLKWAPAYARGAQS